MHNSEGPQNIEYKLLEEVERTKKELALLVSDLIKIKSVNPPGDMLEIAGFIKEMLEESGFDVKSFEPEKGRVNIVTSIGKGKPELVFNGHMDVVPPGDSSKWDFDPFAGKISEEYIYGRGASDMKGGLAGLIKSFTILSKYEKYLRGRLYLVIVPDEETGGYYGTRYLVENNIAMGDYVIIGEPTGISQIDIGQKGNLWLKLIAHGTATHGSLSPYLGDSAIIKALKLIDDLYKEVINLSSTPPPELEQVLTNSEEIADKLLGVKGIGKALLRRPSFNVGIIKGGTKINIVPDYCEAEIDIRIPIGITKEELLTKVKNVADKYNVDLLVEAAFDANYTPPSNEIVRVVANSIRDVTGSEPKLFVQWASSDARFYRLKGIPTIHYGPAEVEGIHGYNERVKISDVVTAAKVYTLSAFRLLTSQ